MRPDSFYCLFMGLDYPATKEMDMSNINTLADRYAAIKAEIDGLTRLLDEVKAEIKAAGREEIVGERNVVTLALSERSTLDTAAVKKLLTAEQIAACTKVSLIETIRVKAIKAPVLA
jgi:ParB-like chromosome segregation protein Spo0J